MRSNKRNTGLELRSIQPLTTNQERVFDLFRDYHLVLHGTAGTGKSFLSLYLALREVGRKYKQVIIIRSAVPTRDLGHLPGTVQEKIGVYEAPYIKICADLYGRGDAYEILKKMNVLEFECTSFLRGTTIDDAVVIVDEIENCSFHELDSTITRFGSNVKVIFAGDYNQTDLVKESEKQGLLRFLRILDSMEEIAHIEFNHEDIVRSGLVRSYIIAKDGVK